MFAAGKTAAVSGGAPDDKFNYVTMLLHGDGTNGAQNNTFVDSSTNNFTITRNGNTTQGSFSPYGSNWSNYFNETPNNYLSVANNAALNMGTGDFTVEAWINVSNIDFRCVVCLGQYNNGAGVLRITNSGNLQWYWNDASFIVTSSTTVTVGTWNHVAVVRSSGTTKLYINGTNSGSASDSNNYSSTYPTWVGAENQGSVASQFFGYISNVRVVKGTAVYTSNFTPSTTPLTAISGTSLLTCQSNRFVDNSTNNFTLTATGTPSVQRFNPFGASTAYSTSVIGGSGYFDGSGDYLTIGNPSVNSAVDFGAGNFTIEAWVCPNSTGPMLVVGSLDNSSGKGSWWFVINGTFSGGGTIQFAYNITAGGTGINVLRGTGTLSVGAWSHVAVTRDGSNIRAYLNGVQLGSTYTGIGSDTIYPVNQNVLVGETVAGDSYAMNGYMSDMRIIKGTALYTGSTYTIPTAPLTAITNTSRLLNFTNGAIFDNAMMNDLETVGNAQISTSVKKYGTGSLKFDGTGDYLFVPTNQNMNFGTGNFTIEMWIYPVNVSSIPYLIDGRSTSTASENVVTLYVDSSQYLTYWVNGSARITASSTVSLNTWSHVAVVKNSGTTTMYLNGTSVGTWTDGTTYIASNYLIGQRTSTSSQSWNGYIDDLRITKGYARYTTNFTAPTAAFPNTGPI